jgi:PAS domain S-box-containing protein
VVASVVLTGLGVREARRIRAGASAIADDWMRRMDRILATTEALRALRQAEAREALAATAAERRPWTRAVDSITGVVDRAIDSVAASGGATDVRTAATAARVTWMTYAQARRQALALEGGAASPALAAFRAREDDYRAVTAAVHTLESVTSASAARLARGSRAETRTVTLVVLASGLLTLMLAVTVVSLVRVDRLRRRAEQRWEDVAGTDLGMVWEIDARARLTFVSEQAARLLGRPAAALLGMRVLDVVADDAREDVAHRFATLLATGAPLSGMDVPVRRADGAAFRLLVSGVAVRDETGTLTGYRGVAVDVTQHRHAEAAAARAQRLDSLGTLAGGIAHDFNNVLHAVSTYADLAGDTLDAAHPARADLRRIVSASERGKRLVERVLTFSRARPRAPEAVDLGGVVDEAVALLRPTLPPEILLDLHTDASAPPVLADPTELHQVVINLLANAVYAMRARGGSLRVRVLPTATDRTGTTLVVADSGVGMSGEVLERIFEPFFTTKPQSEGTGIGLAMVHGIVSTMGGRIDVASVPDEGTTFTIHLPATTAIARPGPARVEEAPRGALAGRRVLLVDDDVAVLDAVGRLLRREGLQVTALADPRDALDSLCDGSAAFDLVVSDLSMPRMNGLELVARLRHRHPTMPVIICSGYGGADGAERARALGVHALLEKPVTARELRDAVTGALAA